MCLAMSLQFRLASWHKSEKKRVDFISIHFYTLIAIPNEETHTHRGRLIMFAFPLDVITRRLQETQSSIGRRQEFVFQLSQQGGMDYFTFYSSFPPTLDFHLVTVEKKCQDRRRWKKKGCCWLRSYFFFFCMELKEEEKKVWRILREKL